MGVRAARLLRADSILILLPKWSARRRRLPRKWRDCGSASLVVHLLPIAVAQAREIPPPRSKASLSGRFAATPICAAAPSERFLEASAGDEPLATPVIGSGSTTAKTFLRCICVGCYFIGLRDTGHTGSGVLQVA